MSDTQQMERDKSDNNYFENVYILLPNVALHMKHLIMTCTYEQFITMWYYKHT